MFKKIDTLVDMPSSDLLSTYGGRNCSDFCEWLTDGIAYVWNSFADIEWSQDISGPYDYGTMRLGGL